MGNEKSRHGGAGGGSTGVTATCQPNETCVICQEDVAENVSRPDCCPDHFFHHDCLMKWAEHKNTCPLDNRVFNHVVDLKGKKVSVPKRKPNEDEEGSEFLRRMLLILSLLNRRSDCSLCGNDSPELERASLSCGHRFHRSCLVKLSRFSRQCPNESCGEDFTEIMCEFGEKIVLTSFDQDFTCSLCSRVDSDIECATSDGCTHRNHRECMEQRCVQGNHTCPQCSSQVRFLRCDLGERVVIDVAAQPVFKCGMCNVEDRTKEAARSTTCGHVFHRECVLSIFRTAEACPMDGCDAALSNLKCHFGDEFGHTGPRGPPANNPLHQVLSEVTCDDEFQCEVCHERKPEMERAKLPCGCEFHRLCITEFARRQSGPQCPKCRNPFDTVRCMFGEVLTVTPAVDAKKTPEPQRTEKQETVGAEAGAAPKCSLCQADVDTGTGCRSSACAHLYHRVCLENIKEVGGSCLICNKDVPLIVGEEEAGATASPPPPPPQPPQQQQQEQQQQQQQPTVLPLPLPPPERAEEALEQQTGRLCSSCHKAVDSEEMVHPDHCDHLYHLSCLMQEIRTGAKCHVCKYPMRGVVVMEDDALTGENCIICREGLRQSQHHQTQCCRQWLHPKCLRAHLEIIRECPACEIAMPE